jgi:ribosomal protein S18 acetylase RimI-like enzyme
MGEVPFMINVILASSADHELYRKLRLAALTDAPHAFDSSIEQESLLPVEFWQERVKSKYIFIGEVDGVPSGLTQLSIHENRWQLKSVWVAPAARGSGLAGELIRQAAAKVKSLGGTELGLWVYKNNSSAIKFYARHGYVLDDVVSASGVHGIYMVKEVALL